MIHIEKFTFNPFSENTYVLYDDAQNAVIVDPGNIHDFETKALEGFISKNNLSINNIILTHAHIDHVLGLQWAYDTYQVPVIMHEVEKEVLDRNPMTASNYGFFMKPIDVQLQYVKEGDVVKIGDEELKIYEVPGHSPGHIAFHHEEGKFIISGDVLFEGSIGRTDLFKGNYEQLLTSVKEKLFVLEPETKVYSGHGNPTTVGFEKDYNPFFK